MRLVCGCGALLLLAGLPGAANAANVEVTLTGLRDGGGTLSVGLQTQDQFMGNAGNRKNVTAPDGGTATVTVENVPPGDYAVVVWHDDNKNGTFDTGSPGGPPLDGWAISNFEKPSAPPQFEQVKITVGTEDAKVSIPMIYGR